MTDLPICRCLGHNCDKLDHCKRHVVIRERERPDDVWVKENVCLESGPHIGFMPTAESFK